MARRYRQGYGGHRQYGSPHRRQHRQVRLGAGSSRKHRRQEHNHQATDLPDGQCQYDELGQTREPAPALGLLGDRDKQASDCRDRHDDMVASQAGPVGPRVPRQCLQPCCEGPGIDPGGENEERTLQAERDTAGTTTQYRHHDRK